MNPNQIKRREVIVLVLRITLVALLLWHAIATEKTTEDVEKWIETLGNLLEKI